MWLVVGLLVVGLSLAAFLVFKRGTGRTDDDDPPQGPRGPEEGERKLTHEGLRADEARKPTTEELPVFSVPQSGEPEPPKEAQEVSPTPISPDVLAAIDRLEPMGFQEDGPTAVDAHLEMATGGRLSASSPSGGGPMKEGSAPEVEDVETTRRSLAGRSLAQELLPWGARQPITEEVYNLLQAADARGDEEASGELRRLATAASSAATPGEIAHVKARLALVSERNK